MSSQKQKRMLSNKLIILLYAVFVSIVLHGCADRHFLQLERKITNDLKFNKAKTVVVDLELDKIDFSERRISLHSNRVIKKGILPQNKKIIIDALSESLSFDGKSVFSLEEYQRIKNDLRKIRPAAGHKDPKLDALIRLKISYSIQTGRYEKERKYNFYRKETRCQYLDNPLLEDPVSVTSLQIPTKTDILNLALPLSNEKPLATFSDPSLPVEASHLHLKKPPKKYKPCRATANSTWNEIRLDQNALTLIDLWYSGDFYINENDQYTHHKSLNGYQLMRTPYQDEKILNQSIAAGLGPIISNNIGTMNLTVRLEIDEGNHNAAIAWLKQGEIEVARKILEKNVIENMFESSTDYYNLGLIYHTYGDFEIAKEYYTKAINAGGYKRMYVEALKNIKVLNEKNTL
jgi:tetratricopeptide (TPR) repeat protein